MILLNVKRSFTTVAVRFIYSKYIDTFLFIFQIENEFNNTLIKQLCKHFSGKIKALYEFDRSRYITSFN